MFSHLICYLQPSFQGGRKGSHFLEEKQAKLAGGRTAGGGGTRAEERRRPQHVQGAAGRGLGVQKGSQEKG